MSEKKEPSLTPPSIHTDTSGGCDIIVSTAGTLSDGTVGGIPHHNFFVLAGDNAGVVLGDVRGVVLGVVPYVVSGLTPSAIPGVVLRVLQCSGAATEVVLDPAPGIVQTTQHIDFFLPIFIFVPENTSLLVFQGELSLSTKGNSDSDNSDSDSDSDPALL